MEQRKGGERKLLTSIVTRVCGGVKETFDVYVCDKDYIESSIRLTDPLVTATGSTQMLEHNIFILEGLTLADARSTVFHEVTHAFIHTYGVHFDRDDLEESLCDFIGTYMIDINDKGRSILEAYRNAGYVANEH